MAMFSCGSLLRWTTVLVLLLCWGNTNCAQEHEQPPANHRSLELDFLLGKFVSADCASVLTVPAGLLEKARSLVNRKKTDNHAEMETTNGNFMETADVEDSLIKQQEDSILTVRELLRRCNEKQQTADANTYTNDFTVKQPKAQVQSILCPATFTETIHQSYGAAEGNTGGFVGNHLWSWADYSSNWVGFPSSKSAIFKVKPNEDAYVAFKNWATNTRYEIELQKQNIHVFETNPPRVSIRSYDGSGNAVQMNGINFTPGQWQTFWVQAITGTYLVISMGYGERIGQNQFVSATFGAATVIDGWAFGSSTSTSQWSCDVGCATSAGQCIFPFTKNGATHTTCTHEGVNECLVTASGSYATCPQTNYCIHGNYNAWSGWSACCNSATTGMDTQSRTRTCVTPGTCAPGPDSQTQTRTCPTWCSCPASGLPVGMANNGAFYPSDDGVWYPQTCLPGYYGTGGQAQKWKCTQNAWVPYVANGGDTCSDGPHYELRYFDGLGHCQTIHATSLTVKNVLTSNGWSPGRCNDQHVWDCKANWQLEGTGACRSWNTGFSPTTQCIDYTHTFSVWFNFCPSGWNWK
eukprot:TRINITY_DN94608_c0_g1_i1.p1 TRINITY_DN94608_c0_g1~~TRINITY_DN94608_c0_g1_i1.p1  ORF type:complete len:578 (-),score=30.86 TRINITY_DN94608_c0_g1_i1:172-1905(-)